MKTEDRHSRSSARGPRSSGAEPDRSGGTLFDFRRIKVGVPPSEVFPLLCRIGGENGWHHADWLWRLRGAMDSLVGGPGMRGRRDPETVVVGDVIDYFRVEEFTPDRRLLLALEVKQAGRGWLDLEVVEIDTGSEIRLTAVYDPQGLIGTIYWYLVYPLHDVVFGGMLRKIALRCDSARPTC